MQNARNVADPMQGPSGHGPSAQVLGNRAGVLTGVGDMYGDPFAEAYPGYDPAHIGYVFTLSLAPGQTASLMTFVVKGLSEVYDPRGGYPIPARDALLSTWSEAVYSAADAKIPAAGSEIARVTDVAKQLAGVARSARAHTAAALDHRQLDAAGIGAGHELHRVREERVGIAAGDDRRHGDQRGHRPRVPHPPDARTIATGQRFARCCR